MAGRSWDVRHAIDGATIAFAPAIARAEIPSRRFRFRAARRIARAYDAPNGRNGTSRTPDRRRPASREVDVKELTFEEVLRIAGGVPLAAALDEVTYRAPAEPPADPVDYARLAGRDLPVAEPS
jgi:hypothetical protein